MTLVHGMGNVMLLALNVMYFVTEGFFVFCMTICVLMFVMSVCYNVLLC